MPPEWVVAEVADAVAVGLPAVLLAVAVVPDVLVEVVPVEEDDDDPLEVPLIPLHS
jgi:hypothetical protein